MAGNIPPSSSSSPYSGNSVGKKKEADKRELKKVTVGNVVERKKPMGRKFVELFGGDDAKSVGQFLVQDVLIPALKSLISETIGGGLDRFLYGSSSSVRSRGLSGGNRQTNTSYQMMYNGGVNRSVGPDHQLSDRARANHDFSELVFNQRGDAEQVLDNLIVAIQEYGMVSVHDLYNLVGIVGSFVDNKFGWTDLQYAEIRAVRGGNYLLVLPRPIDIS